MSEHKNPPRNTLLTMLFCFASLFDGTLHDISSWLHRCLFAHRASLFWMPPTPGSSKQGLLVNWRTVLVLKCVNPCARQYNFGGSTAQNISAEGCAQHAHVRSASEQ